MHLFLNFTLPIFGKWLICAYKGTIKDVQLLKWSFQSHVEELANLDIKKMIEEFEYHKIVDEFIRKDAEIALKPPINL